MTEDAAFGTDPGDRPDGELPESVVEQSGGAAGRFREFRAAPGEC